jgi:hypothetical protein
MNPRDLRHALLFPFFINYGKNRTYRLFSSRDLKIEEF